LAPPSTRQPWPVSPISSMCVSTFTRLFDDEPSPLHRHSSLGRVFLFPFFSLCLIARPLHSSPSPSPRRHLARIARSHQFENAASDPVFPLPHIISEITRRLSTYVTQQLSRFSHSKKSTSFIHSPLSCASPYLSKCFPSGFTINDIFPAGCTLLCTSCSVVGVPETRTRI
jgi:hypothetical protein